MLIYKIYVSLLTYICYGRDFKGCADAVGVA